MEELSQAFVPGRSLSLTDWLANLAGVGLGGALAWRLARA
jgi:VanZ family protein